MKTFFALVLCALTHLAAVAQTGGDKVVYHMDHAASQATKGLRNIRNHLDVAPDTQIVVVTHEVPEASFRRALAAIEALPDVTAVAACLRTL